MTNLKLRLIAVGLALGGASFGALAGCADIAGVWDGTLRNICDTVVDSASGTGNLPESPGPTAFDIEVNSTSPTTQMRFGDPVVRVLRCIVE